MNSGERCPTCGRGPWDAEARVVAWVVAVLVGIAALAFFAGFFIGRGLPT